MGEYSSLERDLSRELAAILRKKVKKITVVDPDKVATWVEAHPKETDPAEVARDFDADIVIFLEVEQFQTQSPGDLNMLHGEARVHIKAFEMEYPATARTSRSRISPRKPTTSTTTIAEPHFPDRGPIPDRFRLQQVEVPDHVRQGRRQGDLLALHRTRPRRLDPGLADREVSPSVRPPTTSTGRAAAPRTAAVAAARPYSECLSAGSARLCGRLTPR